MAGIRQLDCLSQEQDTDRTYCSVLTGFCPAPACDELG